MYQFSLNLNSLQQKFSLISKYLGTNSVIVKRVDCIVISSGAWISSVNMVYVFKYINLDKLLFQPKAEGVEWLSGRVLDLVSKGS